MKEGTYGSLQLSEDKEEIVKRNFKESLIYGITEITEIDILKKLSVSPYIVKVKEFVFQEKLISNIYDPVEIVMEKATSDLFSRNYLRKILIDFKKRLLQLFFGLYFIHYNNIVHFDIKPNNILFFDNQEDPILNIKGIIKYCDFGLSYHLTNCDIPNLKYRTTSIFKSPELILGLKNLTNEDRMKTDIWSLAVTIYFLLTREYLFKSTDEIKLLDEIFRKNHKEPDIEIKLLVEKNNISLSRFCYNIKERESIINNISRKIPFYVDAIPQKNIFNDLLQSMLEINVKKRISIFQILEHEYFHDCREYIENFKRNFVLERIPKAILPEISLEKKRWLYELMNECLEEINLRSLILALEHFIRYNLFHDLDKENFSFLFRCFLYICEKTIIKLPGRIFNQELDKNEYYNLERKIILEHFNCHIFSESLLDYCVNEEECIDLFKVFLKNEIKHSYVSYKELQQYLKRI